MKAWEIGEAFGLEHLRQVDRPDPQPGPGEVCVAVRATSLNFRDLLMVRGLYNPKQKLPLVPLSDGVGEVVSIGDGVTRVQTGDRVAGMFCPHWIDGQPDRQRLRTTLGGPLDGMLAEKIVLPAEGVSHVPSHLEDAEAATLPCAALTAWTALVEEGGIHAGDTVLVQGTGGVSVFALQLAKMHGAHVIATSSSADKIARVEKLGADHVINYRDEPEWGKKARELTGKRGVDLVIEVGGAGTIQQSIRAVRMGGTIAMIGALAGGESDVNLLSAVMSYVRMQGILVGHRRAFESMSRAMEQNRLQPVVDKVFSFDDVPAAFEHLANARHFGKICIRVG